MPFNVQASSPKYHIASAMVTNGNFEMQFRHYQGQQNDVVDRAHNYADAAAKLERLVKATAVAKDVSCCELLFPRDSA